MELPIRSKFKIESTTKFQTFGLIITAEPHSRVELPSSMIVAGNTLRKGTEGMITTNKIEYSGDPETFYTLFSPNSPALNADYNTPLIILGARRAVEIARRADAGRFADTELRDAELKLATLEQVWPRSRSESDLRHNAKNPGAYRIEIEGHTDSVGSDESNLNLSRGRAESVRDYLVQNGVKSERVIATSGFGESKPVADNETAAGRQVNRRVEIIIADQFDKQAKAGNQ
jgi:hypothetical protein